MKRCFRRFLGNVCLWVSLASVLILDHPCPGEDRIVVRSPSGSGRIAITGTIEGYRGTTIRIRTRTGGTREVSTDDVLSLQTPQTPAHRAAAAAIRNGQFREARLALTNALDDEDRLWVRREILALDAQSALALGDYVTAGSRFIALYSSDPTTRFFHNIPLGWGDASIDPRLMVEARRWLVMESPAARLIGASFVLDLADYRELALTELHRLRNDPNQNIAQLARIQLWRDQMRTGEPTDGTIARWEQELRNTDEKLRGGGWFLLGRIYEQRRDYNQAALSYLWLTTVYTDDVELSARATNRAADALHAIGKSTAAAALYREVATRFREFPQARHAQTQLQQIESQR